MKWILSQFKDNNFYRYCNATILLAAATVSFPLHSIAKNNEPIIELSQQQVVEWSQYIDINQSLCLDKTNDCVKLNEVVSRSSQNDMGELKGYFEFPLKLDLNKLKAVFEKSSFNQLQQRQLIQQLSLRLNQLSIESIKPFLHTMTKKQPLVLYPIALNNSFILHANLPAKQASENLKVKSPQLIQTHNKAVVGIIDSGVSQYHNALSEIDVTQFNPQENSFELKDTGFGHASAILSLLAIKANAYTDPGLLRKTSYLSCNGLPNGKYHFKLILRCMNWLFVQPRMDVIVNAWSAPEPGCGEEWRQPIAMLFHAQTIPVFAAGNFAEMAISKNELSKTDVPDTGLANTGLANTDRLINMNRSPANLNFSPQGFLSLTVGALNKEQRRLASSSFGRRNCLGKSQSQTSQTSPTSQFDTLHFQANLMAPGENLTVAVPFTKDSYQTVSGTSYAVVFAAAAAAKLVQEFPTAKPEQITQALLSSAVALPEMQSVERKTEYGYGQLNYKAARARLKHQLSSN